MKTRRQAQQGGTELQAGSGRNRQDVQPDLEDREASGALLETGTTREPTASASGSTSSQSAGLTQQYAGVPPETSTKGKRRKWSKQDNRDIMRAYFLSSKCEREKQGFRKRMTIEWRTLRPDMKLTEDQLANQLYAIRARQLLSELEIRDVKNEVGQMMTNDDEDKAQMYNSMENQYSSEACSSRNPDLPTQDDTSEQRTVGNSVDETIQPEIDERSLISLFRENIIKFGGIDPDRRPRLPKLKPNKQTFMLLQILNRDIPAVLNLSDTLERTHAIVYSAAITIVQSMGVQIRPHNECCSKRKEPPWKLRIERNIRTHRSILTKLIDFEKGNKSKKLKKKSRSF